MYSEENIILTELSNHIREKLGMYFPERKHGELRLKLNELGKENGFKKTTDFINHLLQNINDQKQIELLASKLTVGETYFWRDRELFRVLEENIFPDLIREKEKTNKTIRIWSAGSSSGEEAYSVAILLKRLIPNIKQWNISILATDINIDSLNKAKKGVYTNWSFRSAPPWLKEKHFKVQNKSEYVLDENIRRMVNFNYLNLAKDAYPSLTNNTNGMDIIFCRNVLMYFSLEDIIKITDKFYNCLVNQGILLTSPSESFQYISSRFRLKHTKNISFYLRDPDKESTVPQASSSSRLKEKPVKVNTEKVVKKAPRREHSQKTTKSKLTKTPNYEDAVLYYKQGNYQQASTILESLANGKISQQTHILMAKIKANQGQLLEALKDCKNALNINKLNPEVYYLIAMIEAETGEYEKAYESLKKSFYLDSHFIITNFTLGTLAQKLSKENEAKKYFQNAFDLIQEMNYEDIVPGSDGMTADRLKEIILTQIHDLN